MIIDKIIEKTINGIHTYYYKKAIGKLKPKATYKIAVAVAQDDTVLKSLVQAHKKGFVEPILFGHEEKIREIAKSMNLDLSKFKIVNKENDDEAVQAAIDSIRNGESELLMKGSVHTEKLMGAVVNKENGIRGSGILSQITVLTSLQSNHSFIATDPAILIRPDIAKKIAIINNAVNFANRIGLNNPKVAVIAPVEKVNDKMQSTVDAEKLKQMYENGEIKNCVLEGPISVDLAMDAGAVKSKKYKSPVGGRADILVFNDIDSANPFAKALTNKKTGHYLLGGVAVGAQVPIVLTSRSDLERSRLYAIALACQQVLKENQK